MAMTTLARKVTRLTACRDHRGKPLVIRLEEGGTLVRMKTKGSRRWYTVSIQQIWRQGAMNRLAEIRQERAERRKARRQRT